MKKLDNIFFLIGIVAFALMAMQLDLDEVVAGVKRAGYWFPLVIVLWAGLYVINTASWYSIIKTLTPTLSLRGEGVEKVVLCAEKGLETDKGNNKAPSPFRERVGVRVRFLWLYKVTVAGFALNYATPGGLMGGEAYRISQLTPRIGIEKASSSVILYVMTHIFSHFWFWLASALLYILCYSLNTAMYILLAVIMLFCVAAIWLFLRGYKHGIVNSLVRIFAKTPFLKKKAAAFIERHKEKLDNIDRQIAALHSQNRTTFFLAVFLEFLCRVLSSFEIMFVLLIITPEITFLDSMLILAFTSLFANMLFFLPLQLGGREGGFMMSVSGLSISASAGVFVALIVRLRELFWTAFGLMLIKIGNWKQTTK